MAHTINEYTYNGTQTDYDLSFSGGFRVRSDVSAYKRGAPNVPITFNWLTNSRVRINSTGLVAGDTIVFTRTVSKIEPPVNMLLPNNFTREGVVAAVNHTLQALQEVLDGRVDAFTGHFVDSMQQYINAANDALNQAITAKDDAALSRAQAELSAAAALVSSQAASVSSAAASEYVTLAALLVDAGVPVADGQSFAKAFPNYQSALDAVTSSSFPSRADRVSAIVNGTLTEWVKQAGGPCLGGGWAPVGDATPWHFGAVGDGVAFDTAAVQAALAVGGNIRIPGGTFRVGQINIPVDNTTVTIEGGGVLFLDGPANQAGLTTQGAAGPQVLLAVTGLRGDRIIAVADATGIAAGDLIRVYSTRTVQFNQPMYGELQYVRSVDGNQITLRDGLFADYTTAENAAVRKITPRKNILIQGGEIRGNGTQRNMIEFNFSENVQVKGVAIRNGFTAAISFRTVAHWRVADCVIKDTISPDQGYAVLLEECSQWGSMTGCTVTNAGTGFDIGGSSSRFGLSRFWSVIGNSFYGCHRRGISTHEAGPNGIIAFNHVQCRAGIEGDAGRGIWTRSGDIIIQGNTVLNASGPTADSAAIQATVRSYASGVQIIGNQVLYSRLQGIRLDHTGQSASQGTALETIVSGNIVRDGLTQGIVIATGEVGTDNPSFPDWEMVSITDNTVNGQPGAALLIGLRHGNIKTLQVANNRFSAPLTQDCISIASQGGVIRSFHATGNYLRGGRGFRATSSTPIPAGNGWITSNFIDYAIGAFTFLDAGDRANNKERLVS